LKPVASPVRSGGTDSTIRFGIAANAKPMPIDMISDPIITISCVPCATPRNSSPQAVITPPSASGSFGLTRALSRPDSGPAPSIATEPGSISSPAPVAESAKP
jgi:hypothetical protein